MNRNFILAVCVVGLITACAVASGPGSTATTTIRSDISDILGQPDRAASGVSK